MTSSRGHLLLVTLLYLLPLSRACPNAIRSICHCSEDISSGMGQVIECHGQPVDDLVHLLVQHQDQIGLIKSLTVIESPSVANLSADFFKGLYIKSLAIRNSGIRFIDEHALRGLDSMLLELDLSHNKLEQVPSDAVSLLRSLVVLDLSNNSIAALSQENKLPHLAKLDQINLGNNKVKTMHKSFFDNVKNNIRSINLGHNQLDAVPGAAIRGFRRLEALHLHGNKIEALENMSLMNLPVLSLLNLAHNKISNFSRQAMLNLPQLKLLYLSDNQIEEVLPHHFAPYEELMLVDLSSNRLKELKAGSFADMKNLKELYLANNRIMDIQKGAFNNSIIQVLVLEGNLLTEVRDDMFGGLMFLEQLVLKDNRIKAINQTAFYHTPALVMLDLSRNEIFDIAPSTFTNQDRILLIDLQNNKILRTPFSAFSRRVVTVLLYENPLVCTEKTHMIQQGQAVVVPGHEDIICGPQRKLEQQSKFLTDPAPTTAAPTTMTTSKPVDVFRHFQPGVGQQFTQEQLMNAFKVAESEAAGQPQDSLRDPNLSNPLIADPRLAGDFGDAQPVVIRRPKPAGHQHEVATPEGPRGGLTVRRIEPASRTDVADEADDSVIRVDRPQAPEEENASDVAEEGGEPIAAEDGDQAEEMGAVTPETQANESTTPDIANIPGRIYPMPVPFLKGPRKQNTAVAFTLPPSIVVAPSNKLLEEFESGNYTTPPRPIAHPGGERVVAHRAQPSAADPTTARNHDRFEDDDFDTNLVTSNSEQLGHDAPDTTLLKGDRQLPNILTIVVVSTVGVVVVAIVLGMIAMYRKRNDAEFSPAASQVGGYGYPSNTLTRPLPPHHNYVHARNQFNASQVNTLQRNQLRNSQTYASTEDMYGWMYAPGPYQAYPQKPNI